MEPTHLIILGVFAVIVTRRFAPLLASGMGIALTLGIGAWGWFAYEKQQAIGFAGVKLSRPIFLAIVATWLVLEILSLGRSLKERSEGTEDGWD